MCAGLYPLTLEHKSAVKIACSSFSSMQLSEQKFLLFSPPSLLCFGTEPLTEREEEGGGKARDQTQIIPWYSARENGQVVISLQT